jgi:hypothetical protein
MIDDVIIAIAAASFPQAEAGIQGPKILLGLISCHSYLCFSLCLGASVVDFPAHSQANASSHSGC